MLACRIIQKRSACVIIPKRYYSIPSNPFVNYSENTDKDAIKKTLEIDPNLEHFFDSDTITTIRKSDEQKQVENSEHYDPFDLSDIPIVGGNEAKQDFKKTTSYSFVDEPVTMTTEDFIKKMQTESIQPLSKQFESSVPVKNSATMMDDPHPYKEESIQDTTDEYLAKMFADTTIPKPCGKKKSHFELLKSFLSSDDVPSPTHIPVHKSLQSMISTELPLVVISRSTDPRLNLSIERYIYNNYPDPKDSRNKFAKRLIIYKNSSCIVVGKNQNIFREINLRLASILKIPIIRRFSGGGTVVHDLGNLNFSFICPKEEFDRLGFTSVLIDCWNGLLNLGPGYPQWKLTTNTKGDMVSSIDGKKVSGSAFQISKGRSLHHGTMLLNSDLAKLGKLLKINESRLNGIKDRSTDSISSPVSNTKVDDDIFIGILVESFVNKYGVPSNTRQKNFDNLMVCKMGNVEAQVLKIDDLTELPAEVWEIYKELEDWKWLFGKTPKFEIEFTVENDLKMKFVVDRGRIIGLEYSREEERLDGLKNALLNNEVIHFNRFEVGKYLNDKNLSKQIAWNIDQLIDYKGLGIKL